MKTICVKTWCLQSKIGVCNQNLVSEIKTWFLQRKLGVCNTNLVSAIQTWCLQWKSEDLGWKLVLFSKGFMMQTQYWKMSILIKLSYKINDICYIIDRIKFSRDLLWIGPLFKYSNLIKITHTVLFICAVDAT